MDENSDVISNLNQKNFTELEIFEMQEFYQEGEED